MATDANILMGIKPMQTKDPMELYEAGQRIEQNRLTGLMNTMKMDEYKRGVTDQNTLRDVYRQFGTDSTANTKALYGAGLGKQAGEYAKAQGDLAKDAASTGKTRLESTGIAMTQQRDAVNMITSPDDVKKWLTAGYNNPDLKAVFERFGTLQESLQKIDTQITNPEQLDKWKMTASTNAETLLKQLSPDANARLTAKTSTDNNTANNLQSGLNNTATNATSRANNSATVGATYAGQQLTDQRARDANSIASQGNVIKTETDLRKEFADLPEVKRYKAAYPSFKAIQDAAKSNNPQADINLIYGLAKLYDPESVVREGEYATIANSQAIPERVKSIAQSLIGGGKLTPETKRQILEQAGNRIATFEGEYGKAQTAYSGIATGRGARTENVIPKVGEPLPPQVVKVTSDADYAKVPSGATYTAPDGKTRVKK